MVFSRKPESRVPDPATPQTTRQTLPPTPPRNATSANIPAESIIGSDLSIEGQTITIRSRGTLRINGNIQADVHSIQLVIGEQASIMGSVMAESVEVFGQVSGAIWGGRVTLHASAQVDGDIHSQLLSIEQGASFDGRSRKVTDPNEIAPQVEPTPPPQQLLSQSSSTPPISVPLPRLHG